jgi:hypothetical protein
MITNVGHTYLYITCNHIACHPGARYILGINLHSEQAAISKAQVKRLQEALPASAIESFEVGNEPDM